MLTLTHQYFMQQAYQQAIMAYEVGEVPVGAVVVCDNIIIAKAHNQTELLNDVTAHAEILAITAAANYLGSKYLVGCSLYVSLEPCAMCAGALSWAQVSHLVIGTNDEKRGYQQFKPSILHPRTQIITGIMEYQCANLLRNFFKEKR